MSESSILFFVVIAGLFYWKLQKDKEDGYLNELLWTIRDSADSLRAASTNRLAIELDAMADGIQSAISACANRTAMPQAEYLNINMAVLKASSDSVFSQLHIGDIVGRRSKTKSALYSLSKKLMKLAKQNA